MNQSSMDILLISNLSTNMMLHPMTPWVKIVLISANNTEAQGNLQYISLISFEKIITSYQEQSLNKNLHTNISLKKKRDRRRGNQGWLRFGSWLETSASLAVAVVLYSFSISFPAAIFCTTYSNETEYKVLW